MDNKDLDSLFRRPDAIREAIAHGARLALTEHRRAGDPIALWRDGQVVWIPAEEIVVDEPPNGTPS